MTIEIQIPFKLKIRGKIITHVTWKTNVLKKEIIADVTPSFNAVKKLDKNIAKPANKNEIE